jgi:hypothetical protein
METVKNVQEGGPSKNIVKDVSSLFQNKQTALHMH